MEGLQEGELKGLKDWEEENCKNVRVKRRRTVKMEGLREGELYERKD